MIWALLFTLIFGGNNSLYLVPKLNKHIKRNVENKADIKELQSLLKENRKQKKAFNKTHKGFIKEFKKLNACRNTSCEEFDAVFTKAMTERKHLQKTDAKMKVASTNYISEEEWKAIIKAAQKDINKVIKQQKKEKQKQEKVFQKLNRTIRQSIEDETKKQKALEASDRLKESFFNIIDSYNNYITNTNSTIFSYHTTKEQLMEAQTRANQLRKELHLAITDMHFEMAESTNPREFKKVIRLINKLY
ncbi:hypothetical protein DMA11_24145 [Marinilabiliaceae bacterium JC017]|nr:hypothetical protein DMA11_24145 [Marinilabiliaceae bacterium JC017]